MFYIFLSEIWSSRRMKWANWMCSWVGCWVITLFFSTQLLRNYKMPKDETWHVSAVWCEDDDRWSYIYFVYFIYLLFTYSGSFSACCMIPCKESDKGGRVIQQPQDARLVQAVPVYPRLHCILVSTLNWGSQGPSPCLSVSGVWNLVKFYRCTLYFSVNFEQWFSAFLVSPCKCTFV